MSEDQVQAESVNANLLINKDLALQFALILSSGVPHLTAIQYMRPDLDGMGLKVELQRWMGNGNVQSAILHLQGKPWEQMDLEAKIKFAVDKNYTEMAYFLYANNYNDLSGPEKSKADTCRLTLEQKMAGMAGKMDSLSTFWDDIRTGKLHLNTTNKETPNVRH